MPAHLPLPLHDHAAIRIRAGVMSFDSDLADEGALYARVYPELKRIAHRHLRRADATATLSTTELVHEAFLKVGPAATWDSRAHFFGAASRAMRQVLVDFARRRRALKRGGEPVRLSLTTGDTVADARLAIELDQLVELDDALDRLDAVDARLRQIVELRFFGGFTAAEIAGTLGITTRTVERHWLKARLFLLGELSPDAAPPPPPAP